MMSMRVWRGLLQTLMMSAALLGVGCSRAPSGPAATATVEPEPLDAQPYPAGETVRFVRVDAQQGSGATIIVGLMPTDTSLNGIISEQITAVGSKLTALTFEARDGTRFTIETDADGLPAVVADAAGATLLLDWGQWSRGSLLARSGSSRAQAESRAAIPIPMTAQQRATIDAQVRQIRALRVAVPRPENLVSFTTEGSVSLPLQTLVARDITVKDARGENVSGNSRVTSVSCTPPVTCQWQAGTNAKSVQLNIPVALSVNVPHNADWANLRDACNQSQARWGNWLEHAATATGILAGIVSFAQPETAPVLVPLTTILLPNAAQTGKSINLLRDCDRSAELQAAARTLAASPPVRTKMKFCLATNDRPPLVQCHDEAVEIDPSARNMNLRAFTVTVPGTSGTVAAPQPVAPQPAAPQPAAPQPAAPQPAAPRPAAPQPPAPQPAAPVPVITGVAVPGEVKGGTSGTTTITWSGQLQFPARVAWLPVPGPDGCSPALDCGFGSVTIDPPPTGNSFVMKNTPYCPKVTGRVRAVFDLQIVDGTNGRRSTAYRVSFFCTP